jgi:hypothetical protein
VQIPKLEKLAHDPWMLVAFGALAGVWLATKHEREDDPERGIVMGVLGGLALKFVQEVALSQMGKIAHTWTRDPEPPPVTPFAS